MMLPSHLLATLLLGLLLSRLVRRPFGARDWLLAVGFGVAIDVDHLLQVPRYVMENGWGTFLRPAEMMAWGSQWQGFMHSAWALPLVVGATVAFRSPWPALFWGLHMVLDFVVARHYVRFGSGVEWVIVLLMAAAVGFLLHAGRGATPLLPHAARTFGLPPAWTPGGPAVVAEPDEPPVTA